MWNVQEEARVCKQKDSAALVCTDGKRPDDLALDPMAGSESNYDLQYGIYLQHVAQAMLKLNQSSMSGCELPVTVMVATKNVKLQSDPFLWMICPVTMIDLFSKSPL